MDSKPLVTKTDTNIDLPALREFCHEVMEKYDFDENSQICLTHAKGITDPQEKIYHGTGRLKGRNVDEFHFDTFNSEFQNSYFHKMYRLITEKWQMGRMRLMLCPPGRCYTMHTDNMPFRFHIAIDTNPYAHIVYQCGKIYHIPADSFIYKMNVLEMHSAINTGSTNRVHLLFSLENKTPSQ